MVKANHALSNSAQSDNILESIKRRWALWHAEKSPATFSTNQKSSKEKL